MNKARRAGAKAVRYGLDLSRQFLRSIMAQEIFEQNLHARAARAASERHAGCPRVPPGRPEGALARRALDRAECHPPGGDRRRRLLFLLSSECPVDDNNPDDDNPIGAATANTGTGSTAERATRYASFPRRRPRGTSAFTCGGSATSRR